MRRTIRLPRLQRVNRPLLALAIGAAFILLADALDMDRLRAAYFGVVSNAPESRFKSWLELVATSKTQTDSIKLSRVNDFFNRQIQFESDQDTWGQPDYWATPMGTLAKGAGDCEDFAIAKYYTLLNSGIPIEQLRLTYVRARIGGPASTVFQAHMILSYYSSPEADPLVLDNLINSIQPASRRPDLLPVFSFNGQQIFTGSPSPSVASTSTSRLSRWQDLLRRARIEGFD